MYVDDLVTGEDIRTLSEFPAQGVLMGGDHRHMVLHPFVEVVHFAGPHHGVGLPFVLLVLVLVVASVIC